MNTTALHPGDPVRQAGKRWRMRRMAGADGYFAMVAVDQRPPIFAQLGKALHCAPEAVPFSQVLAAKRALVQAFAPHANAILVDPNWAYPAAADLLNPHAGLLLTLEDHRTTPDRRSHSIADWSVDKIADLGADGVKLLAWYHPRASAEVQAHQQAWVQAVGEACARRDLPFVLELLLYPLGDEDAAAYREDPAKRSDEVLQSVQAFAHPRFQVDLFKLESPLAAEDVPALDDPAAARCTQVFAQLHQACAGRPWVMLSAGASSTAFERVVGHAARAGAAGFLAGRALWADALAHWPDAAAVQAHLLQQGVPRLQQLRALMLREGRPWEAAPWQHGLQAEGEFARRRE